MIYRLFSWQHILTTFVQALTLFCLDVNKKQKQNKTATTTTTTPQSLENTNSTECSKPCQILVQ